MRTKKGVFGIVFGVVVFAAVAWYCGVIEGTEKTYEIRPEIRLPEQRTDAARAIDAYERLMERYMTLSERNFSGIEGDLKEICRKLDSIDGKLAGLSARIAGIEKALGIEPPKQPAVLQAKPKEDEALLQSEPKQPGDTGNVKGSGSYSF
ncbi:MAG TPA: hypothetical protein VJJ98_12930 [Sedimentisphaerales bacterium]|nr:hypothetical protein [Sedimentisphaerales bacterium]